jgi:hypothetical protein
MVNGLKFLCTLFTKNDISMCVIYYRYRHYRQPFSPKIVSTCATKNSLEGEFLFQAMFFGQNGTKV